LVFFALQANGDFYHSITAFINTIILFNFHRIKDTDGLFEHAVFLLRHPVIYYRRSKIRITQYPWFKTIPDNPCMDNEHCFITLKTVPVMLGEKNAYLFCQVLLAGYVVLLFLFRDNGFNHDFWALTITVVITGWLIFKSKWEKNEYYYFFFMDGVLILQYLMLLLFNRIA
jgi:hypothetical protein